MDHPDLPADLALLKRHKNNKKASSKHGDPTFRGNGSSKSTSSNEKISGSKAISYSQWPSQPKSFAPHPAVVPLEPAAPEHQYGYSWRLHPQPEYNKPDRRSPLFGSRRGKPQTLRKSSDESSHSQRSQSNRPQLQSPSQSQYHQQQSFQVQPLSPSSSPPDNRSHTGSYAPHAEYESPDDVGLRVQGVPQSQTQPATPTWLVRGNKRAEELLRMQQHDIVPPVPWQLPNTVPPEGPKDDDDLMLFAAATAGLSPEQPFLANQKHQNIPQRPLRQQTSSSSSSHIGLGSAAISRQVSTSSFPSISASNLTPSVTTSSAEQERPPSQRSGQGLGLGGLPNSAPELPTIRQTHVGHTHPNRTINASVNTIEYKTPSQHRSTSGSKSLDVPRQMRPSISNDTPLPQPLFSNPPNIRASTGRTTSQESKSPSPPTTGTPLSVRAVSPTLPWTHHTNVSAVSLDTPVLSADNNRSGSGSDARRPNPRISAISTVSAVSLLEEDGGVSPIDPVFDVGTDDRVAPPDYGQSQQEAAWKSQQENARRAQELQRRWAASTGTGSEVGFGGLRGR